MTVGDRIRVVRENRGMSQVELASKIGESKQNLYKYESNRITNIPSNKIEMIAKELHVSPCYLMGWEDEAARSTPLSDPDAPFIAKYKRLDHEDKSRVQERVDTLLEGEKYRYNKKPDSVIKRA